MSRDYIIRFNQFRKEYRRGDLIQAFKIAKGIDKVKVNKFFTLSVASYTRGNKFKLCKTKRDWS